MSVALATPIFGQPEYEAALDAGKKILFLTRTRLNAEQVFHELGGFKHPKADRYCKQRGMFSIFLGQAHVFILSKDEMAMSLCGVRCNILVLEDDNMLSEEEMQTIAIPFLSVNMDPKHPDSDGQKIYKLK